MTQLFRKCRFYPSLYTCHDWYLSILLDCSPLDAILHFWNSILLIWFGCQGVSRWGKKKIQVSRCHFNSEHRYLICWSSHRTSPYEVCLARPSCCISFLLLVTLSESIQWRLPLYTSPCNDGVHLRTSLYELRFSVLVHTMTSAFMCESMGISVIVYMTSATLY